MEFVKAVVTLERRPCERKPVQLVIKENIEMKVFSSNELCKVVITHEEEEHSFQHRCLESPVVPNCVQDPELQVQTQPRLQAKLKITSPGREKPQYSVVVYRQKIEMELEVFPPISESKNQLAKPSLNKADCLRWKRLIPQKKRLVVKDVICLPRGHCMSQLDRQIVPQSKDQAALAAMGMSARITIDSSWTATQVQSRLAMLFQEHFVKQTGQTFGFTYLQCVQGTRVLFVPDTPAEGWTGEQVLRISGHGALYILSHHDYSESPGAAEEATAGHWETVLTLEDDGKTEFSFDDLLAFRIGADNLPPLGFSRLIYVFTPRLVFNMKNFPTPFDV
ncbi:uncharacterized protein LOC115779497 [Archocentrus centrarchus]|uniref:uncharacterized protein LOC115779497 n=1 Tax=Archocentrus centrarchus TaxID=63155 RepID=UPI0011EA20B9|nr:uncharacterized protein LOC115779497 [Archocentrus centrarchus]